MFYLAHLPQERVSIRFGYILSLWLVEVSKGSVIQSLIRHFVHSLGKPLCQLIDLEKGVIRNEKESRAVLLWT